MTIAYGREHFQPTKYQGMDIGPFEMTTTIREGESPIEAKRRLTAVMNQMAEEEFAEKLPRFLVRVRSTEGY